MLSTDFVTGSPNWLDVAGPDIDASAAFYTAVFGWTFRSAGPDAGGYGFFQQDGRTVAALGPLTDSAADPAWSVYFKSQDADSTARSVIVHGGTVRVPPADVMDAGRMACFTDPQGADFAVWQPVSVRGLEITSERGALCWTELHTADAAGALAFYRAVFGWRFQELPVPGMTYTVLATGEGDQEDATFGGVVAAEGEEGTRWLPYFGVDDTDALVSAVRDHGGSVVLPAADVPDVGRIAHLADPFGARFAVIRPAPRQEG
ncbi:VOC family protein [Streptomyces sp. NPDC059092]|uniref:VOC family protein n=1 Tax=Streptomyces sp. NPDC059092 TaxID=3346725 RepID=UPI00367B3578